MAFFRGGVLKRGENTGSIGLLHARRQLKEGTSPIGQNDDKSIAWQEHPRKDYPEHHYISSSFNLCGDHLAFGWPRLVTPIGVISFLLLLWALPNYIWTGKHEWMQHSAHAALAISLLGLYYSFFSRYNQFVIFDRKNQLVHISQYIGRRFHTLTWDDFDYIILDHKTSFLGLSHSAHILTATPPWSIQKHGLPWSWPFISRMIESADEGRALDQRLRHKAEETVEFIIDFMTESRTQPHILNVTIEMDKRLTFHAKDDYKRYRTQNLKHWVLVDPGRLPEKPNWIKDAEGNWKKLHSGAVARAGWLGLWGITHTLPRHLRGTRADPAHTNDPDAPRPGLRWYAHENEGTGELANQPDDVIEAVLTEGMGALERFQEAAGRARKAREEAVMHHSRNQSGINPPDA